MIHYKIKYAPHRIFLFLNQEKQRGGKRKLRLMEMNETFHWISEDQLIQCEDPGIYKVIDPREQVIDHENDIRLGGVYLRRQ